MSSKRAEGEQLRCAFRRMDRDNSGTLTINEVEHALSKANMDPSRLAVLGEDVDYIDVLRLECSKHHRDSEEECEEQFKNIKETMQRFDINGDNVITFGEYEIALGITSEPMEEWKRLFREIDTDNSGHIASRELKKLIGDCDIDVSSDAIESWIAEYDVDGDGQLSYEEFIGFVASYADD